MPGADGIQKIPEKAVVNHDLTFGVVTVSSDYPYAKSHRYLSGGAGLCSTAADLMRFFQMILNGGKLNGVRLLEAETVRMMTTEQLGDLKEDGGLGFGFGIKRDTQIVPVQLRSSYDSAGFWSTQCRISPRGDWIVIAMLQLAWDFDLTPQWFAQYDHIVLEATMDNGDVSRVVFRKVKQERSGGQEVIR